MRQIKTSEQIRKPIQITYNKKGIKSIEFLEPDKKLWISASYILKSNNLILLKKKIKEYEGKLK